MLRGRKRGTKGEAFDHRGVAWSVDSDDLSGSPRQSARCSGHAGKIKEQARLLGYIYNRRAASLRTSRSGIIGVVVHDIMNPFYGEILKAIETELDRSRHTFILSNHYDSVDKQRMFVETLLQLGGDGVIMSPAIGTPAEDVALAENNGMPRFSWHGPWKVSMCRSIAVTILTAFRSRPIT